MIDRVTPVHNPGPLYFDKGYHFINRKIGVIQWISDKIVHCPVALDRGKVPSFSGFESAHGNVVSYLDAALIAAQVGQAILYNFDKVDRMESETMWLRRATFSREWAPTHTDWNGVSRFEVTKTNKLSRAARNWRTIDLVAQISDIHIAYSLVHQLPYVAT